MTPRKLLRRLSQGELRNVRFSDFLRLNRTFGFTLMRVEGSHHILAHPRFGLMVNLQEVAGEAKPYQIRQVLRMIEQYNLELKDDQ